MALSQNTAEQGYIRQCGKCGDHYDTDKPEPGSCPVCDPATHNAVIAEQNDVFRMALGGAPCWKGNYLLGMAVTTPGFRALPETNQKALLLEVATFSDFSEENDPWGDHSFGVVEAYGTRIFWKIDIYDTEYSFGVSLPKAHDPAQVRRVLTLYLPIEH